MTTLEVVAEGIVKLYHVLTDNIDRAIEIAQLKGYTVLEIINTYN